jgi:hypothetical protein
MTDNLPQTGGAQSTKAPTPEKGPVSVGDGLFDGIEPPEQTREPVNLEGIGDIMKVDTKPATPDEGVGDFVVVLADIISGPAGGFTKGMVTRISNLVPGFADRNRDEEAVRAECRRLLIDNKAIRLATAEEAETPHVADERNRRISAEKRLLEAEAEIRRMKGENQIAPVPGQGDGEKV